MADKITEANAKMLDSIVSRDSLSDVTEQDVKLLWDYRCALLWLASPRLRSLLITVVHICASIFHILYCLRCGFSWFMSRYYLRAKRPESLARLYKACTWHKRDRVVEFYALLSDWPVGATPLSTALQLLDASVGDVVTRRFAVRVLNARLSDDDLALYMLQLVQVAYH